MEISKLFLELLASSNFGLWTLMGDPWRVSVGFDGDREEWRRIL